MKKNEKGSVIVEATYVFPIIFFVIFFLIYMGDAYYLKSQVDSLTYQAAVLAAADCADPLAAAIEDGTFSTNTSPEMYRYIIPLYMTNAAGELKGRLEEALSKNSGFFAGMKSTITESDVKYKGSILQPTCIATAQCEIKLPIRFIFSTNNISIDVSAKAVAPVVDMGEFIMNVEMIEDYYQGSVLKDKIDELTGAIGEFLNK